MQDVITTLGKTGILVAALTWLIKTVITHFLSKDIDIYKEKLKAESAKEIEKLKVSLQITANEHAVRFSSLYTKRALVISKIYFLLVEIRNAVDNLLTIPRFGESVDIDKRNECLAAEEKLHTFEKFFKKNSIYLEEYLCNQIQKIINEIQEPIRGFAYFIRNPQQDVTKYPKEKSEFLKSAIKSFSDNVPEIMKHLENDFRKILGVDLNTQSKSTSSNLKDS